jgi:hypothetical protein
MMDEQTDRYLKYLEKEMGIMGILSTFCVAVPSLILERLASANNNDLAAIWSSGKSYFFIASVLMLFSAALFYKQRSLLAFYYGRIARGKPPNAHEPYPELDQWKEWADSWTTWIPYHSAFWIGVAATLEYALAFLSHEILSIRQNILCYGSVPILAAIIAHIGLLVFVKDRGIRFQDNPWIEGFQRRFRRKG